MITLAQAHQWTHKYCNVTIIDHKGEQFRVELRDPDGMLIWREWNFDDCSELIKCVQQYGIERATRPVPQSDMYAHLIPNIIAGYTFYLVVLSPDAKLEPFKHYNGQMVVGLSQAFDIAASHNAPLIQGDTELLQWNFS